MWRTCVSVEVHATLFSTAEIFPFPFPVEDTATVTPIIYRIHLLHIINLTNNKVMPDIDFGFGGNGVATPQEPITDLDKGTIVDKDDNKQPLDNPNNGNPPANSEPPKNGDGNEPPAGNATEQELEAGTVITIGENTYTVDSEGNLVDKDNKIFKEAADVKGYLANFDIDNNEPSEINIDGIIKAIGVEITDENDNIVAFDNTPEGIAQYVNEVIELQKQEIAQAGVQTLLDKYPIVSDFLNYYIANGNSYEGFGQVTDRSNITIDENNVAQQEAIIREAYKGRSDIENYVKYLKDSNLLLDTSKAVLAQLQQEDANTKAQFAKDAQARIEAEQRAELEYWNGVKSVIDTKEIAGYKIPDTIIINKNGKQIAATPNDFFNYLYQVDDKGYSRYERELAAKDAKEQLQDDLLRAYLTFTGGSYSNLVDLAVANKETKNLRLKAAENRRKTTVKIEPPKQNANGSKDILGMIGYQ